MLIRWSTDFVIGMAGWYSFSTHEQSSNSCRRNCCFPCRCEDPTYSGRPNAVLTSVQLLLHLKLTSCIWIYNASCWSLWKVVFGLWKGGSFPLSLSLPASCCKFAAYCAAARATSLDLENWVSRLQHWLVKFTLRYAFNVGAGYTYCTSSN